MTLVRFTLACCLALFVTNFAQGQTVFADCPEAASADNYDLWGIQLVEDCDPTTTEMDSLRPAIATLLDSDGAIPLQRKVDTLTALRDQVLMLNTRFPNVSTRSIEAFALALQCDIHQLENAKADMCDVYPATGRALHSQKWQTLDLEGSAYRAVFLDVFDALSPGCLADMPDTTSACYKIMTEQLMPTLELYTIMARIVLPAINRDVRDAVVRQYTENHLRWRNYVQDTGFQYPWELVFNKRQHGGFREVSLGRSAPDQRWVLLHPTAGIYHSDKLADGSQTDLLGIVKLIGQKRWKYSADNKPERIIGLSLTATFADIAGIEDVGYGLMAEYKSFALGVSRHGSKQLIVFNIELQNLLDTRPRSFRQWLTSVGF